MKKARAKLGSTGIFADAPAPEAPPVAVEAKPKASRGRPPSPEPAPKRTDRDGRKPMPFWTTETAKKQLRILAAELDTTQQQLMTEALNLLFQKHKRPPVA